MLFKAKYSFIFVRISLIRFLITINNQGNVRILHNNQPMDDVSVLSCLLAKNNWVTNMLFPCWHSGSLNLWRNPPGSELNTCFGHFFFFAYALGIQATSSYLYLIDTRYVSMTYYRTSTSIPMRSIYFQIRE